MTDPAPLLALARDVAEAVGRDLVEQRAVTGGHGGSLQVDTKSTPTDVVTALDRTAERRVVAALLAARPHDGVLGEEGAQQRSTSGVRWVVDPIDGTVNFLYGIPQWSVSIAADVDGEVVAGVVHNPVSGETWTATRGGGAHLDGRPVQVSTVGDLGQTLVGTGFGYASARRARQAETLRHVLPVVRDIRRAGAASLDLCFVASGRLDAFFERGLAPWDLAAGGLVAREAGARVEGLFGRPAGSDLVIAAGPTIFPALHDLLAPLAPDRD